MYMYMYVHNITCMRQKLVYYYRLPASKARLVGSTFEVCVCSHDCSLFVVVELMCAFKSRRDVT